MKEVKIPRLQPADEAALNHWLASTARRWAAWVGAINLVALVGGFLYVVDFAADRAARLAEEKVNGATQQWDRLQETVLEQVGGSLVAAGITKNDINRAQEQVAALQDSLAKVTVAGQDGRLEELATLLDRHGEELGNVLDVNAMVNNLLPSSLKVGPVVSIACNNQRNCNQRAGLGPVQRKVCFLQKTQFEDVDSNGEWASCQVTQSGGNWVLTAALGPAADDADALCAAQCLSW